MFLIGGLSDSASRELGPIAHYLMATAVVVSPPQTATSVEEAAAAVVTALARVQPCGPYTLLGRGWGGCVALEAGRIISERQSCYVTVFLFDASPDALQAAIQPLHNQASGLQTALLKYLLKLDREVSPSRRRGSFPGAARWLPCLTAVRPQTEELVYRAPDWSARLSRALGSSDAVLEAALTCVMRRVQSILDYQTAGPVNPKLAVSLVSSLSYHLQPGTLTEVGDCATQSVAPRLRPQPSDA